MMDSTTHDDPIDVLARVGRRAMPQVGDLADVHLAAVTQARLQPARVSSRGAVGRQRRVVVASAAAALVLLVPSLAFAGALPEAVQHAASQAAAKVGIDVPDAPRYERRERAERAEAAAAREARAAERAAKRESTGRPADPGRVLPNGDHVPGKGRPEAGEQRGNRFGQRPEGPDAGKAAESHGTPPGGSGTGGGGPTSKPPKPTRPDKPSKPETPAKPATPAPANPAPAPSSPADTAPSSGGNGGGGNGTGSGGGNGKAMRA